MDNFNTYAGYKEILMDTSELSEFYGNINNNHFNCLTNEYVIIKNDADETVDYYKWSGNKHERVLAKTIPSNHSGKIKARNPQQVLAIDMLYNPDTTIKVLTGVYGSGKDYFMSSVALDLIKKNTVEKIVWVRNNISVKDTRDIGALPGTVTEKVLPFALPLADHLGGINGLEYLMAQGKVEVVHLGFIRGRDIKNSILMCSEVENMTKDHIKLLIGRVSEGSMLWLNGDYRQTDAKVFEDNNGLLRAIDKLKGHPMFGYVHLPKTERSKTAALADLLN